MRCGTTSLARYLRAHPQAFVSVPKEIRFFDVWFERGIDWYKSHFEGATGQTAIGEASPSYMYVRESAKRMAAVIPEARLIALLRNPVDRAYSHYWHARAKKIEPLSFEGALAAEPSRLEEGSLRSHLDYSYLDRGRYLPQLLNVTSSFPRDALLVILFEDLRDEPQRTFATVCDFLGLDPSQSPPEVGRTANPYRRIRSVNIRRLSRRLPGPARRAMGRLNTKAETYPKMAGPTRLELSERFQTGNEQLAEWLGRDLSIWDG